MKKIVYLMLSSFLVLSCAKTIKSEPKFEIPKYSVSEQNFKTSYKDADSLKIETGYEYESTIFYSSSVNKLIIKMYFNKDKSLTHKFMEDQFEKISSKSKKEISNLSEYDVLEVEIFNKNSAVETFEKIIKK